MESRRIDQDAVHRESRQKQDDALMMKHECVYARKRLEKYLHGHLFTHQKIRIDRHLRTCAVCSSEFNSLERAEETRLFLKELTPAEGITQRLKEGVSSLARLRKVLYRPLWVVAILAAAIAVTLYLGMPRQLDVELESIVKTDPTLTLQPAPLESLPTVTVVSVPVVSVPAPAPPPLPVPEAEPLAVSIIPINETDALRQINEVMRGHGHLRKKKFSATEREITGKLTAKDLLTFFNRIESVAKVRFNRKRFESFPSVESIPFVLTLKPAPRTTGSSSPPAAKPEQTGDAAAAASRLTASAPGAAR